MSRSWANPVPENPPVSISWQLSINRPPDRSCSTAKISLTIEDNILLPLVLQQKKPSEMKAVLTPLVRKIGIDALLKKYPCEVSGGQKQRTAIARARQLLVLAPK